MITLASHKTLLEKNIIKDLKPNKDGVEIEMFVSPSEEQKSPQSEFSLKKPVFTLLVFFFFNFSNRMRIHLRKKIPKDQKQRPMGSMILSSWRKS